ncbi:MAG: transcription termination/antitermination protein NusA [Bacteroidetes bacterium]|nr:transcription termination/antitermination protein NusA [Bacteroidota bacterium]
MDSDKLVESFAEFAKAKKIDRPIVIKILDDVFRTIIKKKFDTDENFDIIINLDKGDLQIWRFRQIVSEDSEELGEPDKISISEARKIEPDFEIGEEVAEEININNFGRRVISIAKQTLLQKIKDLEKDTIYKKYASLEGEIISAEVHQVLTRETVLIDEENNELILPKSQQISKDRYKKGELVKAVVDHIELHGRLPKIILSRTTPIFLTKLLENNVPEITDGLITIKKVVREPGERAKVAVESYDERIDPVGACVGMKGSRIYNIVRELKNENIDIINYTDNLNLYISRALNPAKINSIQDDDDRISVYLKPDQVSLAIGKGGQNIKLASKLIGKEIDVYREINDEDDINIYELKDQIDSHDLEKLKQEGLVSAKKILNASKDEIVKSTGIDIEVIDKIYNLLEEEFKNSKS